jgi:hypothetical protein
MTGDASRSFLGLGVKRHAIGTPDRHPKGTPLRNIDQGKGIIADKRTAARKYLDKHPFYDDDMLLRETIQRYNGGAYYQWDPVDIQWVASPKDGGTYVDKVLSVYRAKPWA